MSILNQIQLIERIHETILHKSTGAPRQFAKRLNISVRTLYRIIDELRCQDVMITFDPVRSSYVYENEEDFKLLLKILNSGKNK